MSVRKTATSAFREFCGSSSDQVPLPRSAVLLDCLLALSGLAQRTTSFRNRRHERSVDISPPTPKSATSLHA